METPYSSSVDSSRPFRSVKEAVAIFGERILVAEIYSPKPYHPPPPPSRHDLPWMFPSSPVSTVNSNKEDEHQTLKKLETELEQTKVELKQLKERESETELVVASLNAELQKNMSKLAEAEAAAAKKAARRVSFATEKKEDVIRDEEKKRELMIRMENSATLTQILSLVEEKGYFGSKEDQRKKMKKKPIVPLVKDLFFRKKGLSTKTLNNPLFASARGVV